MFFLYILVPILLSQTKNWVNSNNSCKKILFFNLLQWSLFSLIHIVVFCCCVFFFLWSVILVTFFGFVNVSLFSRLSFYHVFCWSFSFLSVGLFFFTRVLLCGRILWGKPVLVKTEVVRLNFDNQYYMFYDWSVLGFLIIRYQEQSKIS